MNPLAVQIAGVRLESPLVLASGILGTTASSLRRVALAGAGAVTAKSCSLRPRQGHPAPCILPWKGGMLNAVGLSNPGADGAVDEFVEYQRTCATPLIASIFADSPENFGKLVRIIAGAKPDLIEVNVSCPNVESEFGTPFAADPDACARVIRAVKENAGEIPVAIKLSAQCASLAKMAEVCQQNGADAITAINTVGPGMWIDTGVGRPVLANKVGGVSGPAILPIAVRAVYEIRQAVDLPIIGTGGVSCADDALQMIMAGADAVGIGSAIYENGIELFGEINRGLDAWLQARGLESLAQVRGRAHRSSISNIQYPISNDQGSRRQPKGSHSLAGRVNQVGVTRVLAAHRPASPLAQGQRGLENQSTSHGGLSGEIHTLPIREIVVHYDGLKSYLFEQTFEIEPGQFVMLWIPGVDEKPFSVSDVRGGQIEITAKAVGPFSRALMDCRPGDRLGLRGPLGRGFQPRGRGLVVGGGMGIAPLRYLTHWLEHNGMQFRTVLGARTAQDLMFADDFARMGARFATDDGSRGAHGRVLPLAEQLCADEKFDVIYGCGPEVMLVALKKLAERAGCDCQFSLERHMKCGIGICGSCCVDGSGICICREGPVLDKAQLDLATDFGRPHRDATGARRN